MTCNGIYRKYNEDKLKIITNGKYNFSYFSIFDGHNGTSCANFLSENLYQEIIKYYDKDL